MASLALAFDILAKDHASKEFDKVGDAADRTGKKGHGFGIAMGAGLAVAGAAAVAFGKKAVDAAIEGEQSHARLAQAIKNSGGSMEELEPKVNALSTRFAKFGYENDAVESALATMTTSLHDPQKAMDSLGLAADLAATKHIDLETASLAVAKAQEGQLRPLKQLGIDLPVAAGGALKLQQANTGLSKAQDAVQAVLEKYPNAAKAGAKGNDEYERAILKVQTAQDKVNQTQDAGQKITEALAKAVGGQASASADTYAGKVAAMHARMANLTEEIGVKLLPVISTLIEKFTSTVDFIERNSAVMGPLIGIVAGLAGGILVVNQAVKAWAAAQAALDVVLNANPIGIVVIAIAALVAGIVIAWKHSETFRDVVKSVFSAVAGFVLGAIDIWLGAYQKLFEAMGHIPIIGDKFKAVADKIGGVRDKVEGLKTSLNGLPEVKHIRVDLAVNGINTLQGATDKLNRLDGARATGGPVRAGGSYLVGELGPEIVRFGQAGTVTPNSALGGETHIHITAPTNTPEAVAAATTLALRMA